MGLLGRIQQKTMREINSRTIGPLKQNPDFDDWWTSEAVAIPFFDNIALPVTFMDYIPTDDIDFASEADNALQNFLAKGPEAKMEVSGLVFKNCKDFLDIIGFTEQDKHLWNIQEKSEIWKYVTPSQVYVARRPYNDRDVYVIVACECDWEQEHGLQLVFRQGKKITRVSDQDGHLTEADAYDKPDSEDELLSSFES